MASPTQPCLWGVGFWMLEIQRLHMWLASVDAFPAVSLAAIFLLCPSPLSFLLCFFHSPAEDKRIGEKMIVIMIVLLNLMATIRHLIYQGGGKGRCPVKSLWRLCRVNHCMQLILRPRKHTCSLRGYRHQSIARQGIGNPKWSVHFLHIYSEVLFCSVELLPGKCVVKVLYKKMVISFRSL